MVGSVFLLLAYFPVQAYTDFIGDFQSTLAIPNNLTMGLISLYLAFSMGYSLSKTMSLEPLINGLSSVVVFLIMVNPIGENGFETTYLGSQGIFMAIIAAIFTVCINKLFKKRGLIVSMPKSVPPIIAASFEMLFSTFAIVLVVWLVRDVVGVNIPNIFNMIFAPLVIAADSVIAVIVESLLNMLLWFAGIHGHSVVSFNVGILSSFALGNIDANAAAHAAGEAMPYIVTPSFESFFQQGSVATTAICVLMIVKCRSKHMKQVGKIAAVPGFFGVTEPLWFGLPIILNPVFLIPFVFTQIINLSLTYFVMYLGIVGKTYIALHWALPGLFGSFLSTGDWKAVVWWLLLLVLDCIIYYPFLMIYDKEKVKEESGDDEVEAAKEVALEAQK